MRCYDPRMDTTSAVPDRRTFLAGAAAAVCGLPAGLRPARERLLQRLLEREGLPGPDAYTLDPDLLYLNHASIGTIPAVVQEAQIGYLRACESNPWLYMWGGAWDEALASTRRSTAEFFGVAADDLAITRNTTEGFNVLARGLPLGAGDEVLFSNLNHAGASLPFDHAAEERGFSVRRIEIPLDDAPGLSDDDLVALHADAVRDQTRVVVLPHVDNILGLRQPIARIAAAVREKGVRWVFADGAQATGAFPVDLPSLGVDGYATSPHKWLQAPKGTGLLWTTPALREHLRALIVTWGQGRWAGTARIYEDYGTRALPNVLALGDAVLFQRAADLAKTTAQRRALRDAFRDAVDAEPGVTWASPRSFDSGASLFALRIDDASASQTVTRLFEDHRVVTRGFGDVGGQIRVAPNAVHTAADVERFVAALRAARRG